MPFRLRYLAHDLELPLGDFVVGRSADCQLALDDPLVSRRHGVLRVGKDAVVVEDLGSRNGVVVNGAKISGPREVVSGDVVKIGSHEMTVLRVDEAGVAARREADRRITQTLGAFNIGDIQAALEPTRAAEPAPGAAEGSKVHESFRLLGGMADKALAMGRAEEAERVLTTLLTEILNKTRENKLADAELLEKAARYAARLAGATSRGSWVDYVVDLYAAARRPFPAPIVDELYTVVRKVKTIDLPKLRDYLADLRELSATFGPAERFLIQRVEGLERLAALK